MKKRCMSLVALLLLMLTVLTAAACRDDGNPEETTVVLGEGPLPEIIETVPPEEYDFGVEP